MTTPTEPQTKITAVDFNPFVDGELLLTAPVTESQKEIWASVQMGNDANCAFNLSQKLWLRGLLNVGVLRLALQEIVLRHEALRTTFSPDGVNLCIVASLNLEIPEIDLSGLDSTEREQALAKILRQDVEESFDLEHGPLLRLQLIKTQAEEHLLLLTAHHIICDGWSLGVLMTDLSKLYTALKNGDTPELDEPECFSEYAIVQQKSKGSEEEIETETYWLNQFSNSIPVLDFPTDRPRPAFRTFNASREDWDLEPTLVSNLKQLGNKLGCSFTTTLLTSFEVFLHRLTGSNEIMVGIPAAGQAATGNYQLVGHCVNLLPLKSWVDGEQIFKDYLQMRRPIILDAYDHQQFTFGSLIEKLSMPRDASRIPLVPIVFNLDQALDDDRLFFEDLKIEFSTNSRSYENFEIFINATELRGKVTLECQYNTNLFDVTTIRRRLAEFETLLNGIVAAPDTTIDRLPLLPEAEQLLLTEWNQTQVEYPQDKCIHQLFEEQVERTPDAIAVSFQDEQLTYRELNNRSNQLAHYLQNLGVNPGVLVGICVERSLEMIVGLLGILKAGGAYVPLDPAYPTERLAYMLADSQMTILVTQQDLVTLLPEHQAKVIYLDGDWKDIVPKDDNLLIEISPEKLAYVIYTSGSTGKPKGVQIPHGAVTNFLNSMRRSPGLIANDTLLAVTTISFDIAVLELYFPLIVGAKVILATRELAVDGMRLLSLIETSNITVMQATPATWQLLIASGWNKHSSLKILCGGEALSQRLANQLLDRASSVWNMYGPTEATVWATTYQVSRTSPDESQQAAVLIGKPIDNAQIHILDQYLQPVPIGVRGELYIAGTCLARGYLNRPDLNTEKFVTNPFSNNSKSRLYRTGDIAKYLPNGEIEYIGRIDNQVKIRGFRIELGEIEMSLAKYPDILETTVIVREDLPDDKRIVAYIVPRQDRQLTVTDLNNFLSQNLPQFMLPSSFVVLDSFPMTPNGKIDRKALPAPDTSSIQIGKEFIGPSNPIEEFLASLWIEILGIQQLLSIHDNFFELGGHSLLAMRVIFRCREKFSVEITLQSLFEKPTIAGLRDRIKTLLWLIESQKTNTNFTTNEIEEFEL